MSKSEARGRRKRAGKTKTSDGAIYLGLAIIGLAIVAVAFLLEEGWGPLTGSAALGYVAVMAWFAHASAWAAYRGKRTANWRQALARLPLRPAGFGTKSGKPLAAAHDVPAARTAIVASGIVTLAVLLVLAPWLVPWLRFW